MCFTSFTLRSNVIERDRQLERKCYNKTMLIFRYQYLLQNWNFRRKEWLYNAFISLEPIISKCLVMLGIPFIKETKHMKQVFKNFSLVNWYISDQLLALSMSYYYRCHGLVVWRSIISYFGFQSWGGQLMFWMDCHKTQKPLQTCKWNDQWNKCGKVCPCPTLGSTTRN